VANFAFKTRNEKFYNLGHCWFAYIFGATLLPYDLFDKCQNFMIHVSCDLLKIINVYVYMQYVIQYFFLSYKYIFIPPLESAILVSFIAVKVGIRSSWETIHVGTWIFKVDSIDVEAHLKELPCC